MIANVCWSSQVSLPIVLAAEPGAGGFFSFLLIFAPLFAIWYFLVIRPQQNQRRKTQEMLTGLKTGDRVVTSGGIYGTVVGFRDNVVQLQVASQVRLDFARSAISGLAADGESKPDASAAREPARKEGAAKAKQ